MDVKHNESADFTSIMNRKNDKMVNTGRDREVKKWNVPQGYCLEKGKIMPDSIFFSDKSTLQKVNKSKIEEIRVWTNS